MTKLPTNDQKMALLRLFKQVLNDKFVFSGFLKLGWTMSNRNGANLNSSGMRNALRHVPSVVFSHCPYEFLTESVNSNRSRASGVHLNGCPTALSNRANSTT